MRAVIIKSYAQGARNSDATHLHPAASTFTIKCCSQDAAVLHVSPSCLADNMPDPAFFLITCATSTSLFRAWTAKHAQAHSVIIDLTAPPGSIMLRCQDGHEADEPPEPTVASQAPYSNHVAPAIKRPRAKSSTQDGDPSSQPPLLKQPPSASGSAYIHMNNVTGPQPPLQSQGKLPWW